MKKLNFNKDSSPKKTEEFDTEVLISREVYDDVYDELVYRQFRRFMRHEELEKFGVVQCARCGKLMTGGYSDDKNRYCYMCSKELTLQDVLRIAKEKGL